MAYPFSFNHPPLKSDLIKKRAAFAYELRLQTGLGFYMIKTSKHDKVFFYCREEAKKKKMMRGGKRTEGGGGGRRRRMPSSPRASSSSSPVSVSVLGNEEEDDEGEEVLSGRRDWRSISNNNNDNNPRSFPYNVKQKCWDKAEKIKGRDPDRWRRDPLGNIVFRKLVGCPGCLCHDYDHITPFSKVFFFFFSHSPSFPFHPTQPQPNQLYLG